LSYSIDLNILLYASNSDSIHHKKAAGFLKKCVHDPEILILACPTVFGYLRISTHSGIFPRPLDPEVAMENVRQLIERPQVRLISEGEEFFEIYSEIADSLPVRGNLVPDAHLAALLKAHGVKTLYTNDTDFLKFGFLNVRNPLVNPGPPGSDL